jgi:DHA3 family tetracycline resistance protein-like MFS transporter
MAAWGGFAFSLILTAYALYYITVARLDPLQLVLVGTALEASYFICEIPTGVLADTFSRRFSVVAGHALIGIAWIGQGLVPTFVAIAAFEILRGLGEAFVHGATEAWIAGEVGDDAVGQLFLREAQLTQAAGFIGLPVGVALGLIDLRIPVVLGGVLIFALALTLILAMPERRHPRGTAAATWRSTVTTANRAFLSIRTSAVLAALLGAELFWGAASEGYDRLWEIHLLQDLGFPPFGVPAIVGFGALSLFATLVVIVSAQVARRVVRDLGDQAVSRVLVGLQAVRVIARAAFAVAPSIGFALVPFFAESVVRAVFAPLFNAWLIRGTRDDVRATVLSATSVANALGQVGGGPVSGAIGRAHGVPLGLLSSAALLVPAVAFFARAVQRRSVEIVTRAPAAVTTYPPGGAVDPKDPR